MAEFTVTDEDLAGLKGTVVLVTGCASGIGLATVNLLLSIGAHVVAGDINAPPSTIDNVHNNANFSFLKTDVRSWSDLTSLFDHARQKHGRIDHVFANAGITTRTKYLSLSTDEQGGLMEPDHSVLDINLRAVINTVSLAIHHMRPDRQPQSQPQAQVEAAAPGSANASKGGSIVITASASSWQRFRDVDYTAAKHGVLGLMRGLHAALTAANLPIRINVIAPSWTVTGMIPAGVIEAVGKKSQDPSVPARSAAVCMADASRNGQVVYTFEGRFKEVEQVFQGVVGGIVEYDVSDDTILGRVEELVAKMKAAKMPAAAMDGQAAVTS